MVLIMSCVALLISCLLVLSILERKALKTLNCSCGFICFFLLVSSVFGSCVLKIYYQAHIHLGFLCFLDEQTCHVISLPVAGIIFFILKPSLSDIERASSAFFISVLYYTFQNLFTFNVFWIFIFKLDSRRKRVAGSCFFYSVLQSVYYLRCLNYLHLMNLSFVFSLYNLLSFVPFCPFLIVPLLPIFPNFLPPFRLVTFYFSFPLMLVPLESIYNILL